MSEKSNSAAEKAYRCSVIICYTNTTQLDEALKYLSTQTIASEVEILALDNREGRFLSCAKALNFGAEQAKSDIVVFMHQDVYLWDEGILERYCNALQKDDKLILGVAGIPLDSDEIVADILEGEKQERLHRSCNGEQVEAKVVDECLFAMRKSLWQTLRFDEETCDNWHLYAVDICYANSLSGGKNAILSAKICHASSGNALSREFERGIKKLVKKYKGKLNRIRTTCVSLKCSYGGYLKYKFSSALRRFLRKIGIYRLLKR